MTALFKYDPSSRVDWAAKIIASHRASFEAVIETGRLLLAAKEALPHGEFLAMVEGDLPFKARAAQMLMAIASDERIANANHGAHLPSSWRTLYELTRLDDDELQEKIEDGTIRPDMQRKDLEPPTPVAELPKEKQRELLEDIAASADGRKALKQVAKEVRADEQATRHVERQVKLEEIAQSNPDFPAGRLFSLVLIDVPRHHNVYSDETGSEKAPESHYPTMSFAELIDFPIDRFAAPDSIIAYWSTAASLLDDIDILAEWGFVALRPRDGLGKLVRPNGQPLPPAGAGRYGSHQIWRKVRAGAQTGMGRWFRDQHELLIVARRGKVPAPLPGTQDESVFDAPIGDHSAKPGNQVRAWIDRCWPHLSKIEVFARGTAPAGWVFWGNQARAPDAGLVDPAEARLRPMGAGGSRHCGSCDHRLTETSCEKLRGPIALDQLCNLYKPVPHVVLAPGIKPPADGVVADERLRADDVLEIPSAFRVGHPDNTWLRPDK